MLTLVAVSKLKLIKALRDSYLRNRVTATMEAESSEFAESYVSLATWKRVVDALEAEGYLIVKVTDI